MTTLKNDLINKLSLPLWADKFILYVCISIPALQTDSSGPLLQISYICVNRWRINWGSSIDIHTLPCIKWVMGSSVYHRENTHALWWPRREEWWVQREAQERGHIWYIWLIPDIVEQKLTQYIKRSYSNKTWNSFKKVRKYTCFDAFLSKHPTLTFSHRVQKSVLYICVSFSVLHIGYII